MHPLLAILLVEDNVVNQAVVRLYLKRLGYTADIANNGLEALTAIDSRDYDVVLMDVQMPELDGLETTRRLRARPLGRQPHIIAMTASAMAEDQEACRLAGMNEVITKPFKFGHLSAALLRCAERKEAEAVVRSAEKGGPLDSAALAQVREMMAGDAQALAQLVDAHIATSDRLLAELKPALLTHDVAALRQLLHSLVGCTGFFGERRLVELVAELAAAVRQEHRAEVPAIFEAVLREYQVVRAALVKLAAT